eukprot:g38431.t1
MVTLKLGPVASKHKDNLIKTDKSLNGLDSTDTKGLFSCVQNLEHEAQPNGMGQLVWICYDTPLEQVELETMPPVSENNIYFHQVYGNGNRRERDLAVWRREHGTHSTEETARNLFKMAALARGSSGDGIVGNVAAAVHHERYQLVILVRGIDTRFQNVNSVSLSTDEARP